MFINMVCHLPGTVLGPEDRGQSGRGSCPRSVRGGWHGDRQFSVLTMAVVEALPSELGAEKGERQGGWEEPHGAETTLEEDLWASGIDMVRHVWMGKVSGGHFKKGRQSKEPMGTACSRSLE